MAEEIISTGGVEAPVVEAPVVEAPTSLIDVVVEEPIVEEVVVEEVVEEVEDVEETPLDVEKTLEDFGDLMEEGKLNELLEEFNEGKMTNKELINKVLNEVGIAKDAMEEEIDNEIEAVKQNLIDKPIEGIDLADLGGWVSKQGAEMVKIASDLTDFSLGEDAVRSAIALLNKVRMGTSDVGDPEIKIVAKTTTTRDSLRDEYMEIYQTKDGNERTIGVANLIKKAEKTGDVDLISWANGMFN